MALDTKSSGLDKEFEALFDGVDEADLVELASWFSNVQSYI